VERSRGWGVLANRTELLVQLTHALVGGNEVKTFKTQKEAAYRAIGQGYKPVTRGKGMASARQG
jgi:hypothetical protein